MRLLIAFFFSLALSDYCPANRLTVCTNIYSNPGTGCNDYYQFNPSTSTSLYPNVPVKCEAGDYDPWRYAYRCKASTTTCEPPCTLTPGWKTGGPSGKICTGFLTQSNCNSYYADNGGDKWCFWSGSQCYQGITCHN